MFKFMFLGLILGILELTPKSVALFDATNSDDYDPNEAMLSYPPKPTEMFMPPCCGLKVAPCTNTYYRRMDGSCTNFLHPEWGVPNSTYYRIMSGRYADSIKMARRGADGYALPSARLIRTSLFPTGQLGNPSYTLSAMQFGQFLAHDMSLLKEPPPIPCCTASGQVSPVKCGRYCYPVKIPETDATMGRAGIRCTNFSRTVTDKDMGCSSSNAPAQQINVVSSFIDLSNVYGLNDVLGRGLRSLVGGKLRVDIRNNKIYPPRETNVRDNCPCSQGTENACYLTGDSRTNQNPHLTIIQILFLREHNRIAYELTKINPTWLDERVYQEARRILIACFQRITYYEWLPIFLGGNNMLQRGIAFNTPGFVNDYNPNVNPAVSSEHAHGAFRFFHTNIAGFLRMLSQTRAPQSTIQISDWFNRPTILETGTSIDQLTMGMVTQNMEESDNIFVEQITDKMFACPGVRFGIDLRATDFQRDRDHGLAYYNEYRRYCGLLEARTFDEYGDTIDARNIAILKTLYRNHLDVDLSVGGALERLIPGTQAGPTFLCIMNEQFRRTRQADRLFFENVDSGFTQGKEDRYLNFLTMCSKDGIKVNGVHLKSLRYADDTVLVVYSPESLQIINRVTKVYNKYGLNLNTKKTK